MQYDQLASDQDIKTTITALKTNGIEAVVVDTGQQAKEKVLELVPAGEEVMTMSSVTLDSIGLPEVLNESGKYKLPRPYGRGFLRARFNEAHENSNSI